MAIPENIMIKNNELPDEPGVYFYYGVAGDLLYIGKATSLKKRVGSYFTKAHNERLTQLVAHIAKIEYIQTPTVLEALVLEANQIHHHQPPYNILLRDDKSFLYLCITNEEFPRPQLVRGGDLERFGIEPFARQLSPKAKEKYLAVFGPYTSGYSLKKALDYIRKIIPWTDCQPPSITGKTKACFYRHLKQCPGVCTGEISAKDYKQVIKDLILFFEGHKEVLVKRLEKEMKLLAAEKHFEEAAVVRNRLFQLQHIQDVAFISKEDVDLPFAPRAAATDIDILGRIEAYDISNISGTSAVGVMTVFIDGRPAKDQYRKFKIKTVQGANDFAMMNEVLRRRLIRAIKYPQAWPLPEVLVIDGGLGQVGEARAVLKELNLEVPVIGLAKGFDRKQDRLVFDRNDKKLLAVAERGKEIFQKVRDEAHRFSVKYHRVVRAKTSGITKKAKQK